MKILSYLWFIILAVATLSGCSRSNDPAPAVDKPFLQQSKEIPPSAEWSREIDCLNDTDIRILVEGSGPMGITIVSDAARAALLAGDTESFKKMGVQLTEDADSKFDRTLPMAKGRHWVMIQNQSQAATMVKLSCYNR